MELATFLIKHINDPCEDLDGNNIRDFYIREAKRALLAFNDDEARRLLETTIDKYKD